MRRILPLFLILGLFGGKLAAQDPETPREIWCHISQPGEKHANDFQFACRILLAVMPDAQDVNQLDMERKLYLNKMRAILKRGSGYTTLAPKMRVALSHDAVNSTNKFISWHEGMRNRAPEGAKMESILASGNCEKASFNYPNMGAWSRDINYIYVECMNDENKRIEEKFWCVLQFLAAMAECDASLDTFK